MAVKTSRASMASWHPSSKKRLSLLETAQPPVNQSEIQS